VQLTKAIHHAHMGGRGGDDARRATHKFVREQQKMV